MTLPRSDAAVFVTLDQARAYVREHRLEGVECPCCNQFAKVWPRKITSVMAAGLIVLRRLEQAGQAWVDVKDINKRLAYLETANPTSDFAKLDYWGLIESKPNDDDKRRASGLWRSTENGRAYADGDVEVSTTAFVYDGEVLDFSPETSDIEGALKDRFSYIELWRDIRYGVTT